MGAVAVVCVALGLLAGEADLPSQASPPPDAWLQEEVDDLETQPSEEKRAPNTARRLPDALVRMAALGGQVGGCSLGALILCGLGAAGVVAAAGIGMFLLGPGWACTGAMALVASVPVGVVTALVSYLLVRLALPVASVYPPGRSPGLKGRVLAAAAFMLTDMAVHAAGVLVVAFSMVSSVVVTGVIAGALVAAFTMANTPQGAPNTPGWQWMALSLGLVFGAFLGGPIALGVGGAVALGMVGLVQVAGPFAAATTLELVQPSDETGW